MDGATLVIQFKDETSTGPAGVATTSPVAGGQPSSHVQETQSAITSAGGVAGLANKNNPALSSPTTIVTPQVPSSTSFVPVPSVVGPSSPSSDPLLKTVEQIVQADPRATAEEIAKALGMKEKEAQSLLNALQVPPGGNRPELKPVPAVDSLLDTPELQADVRRAQEDSWIAGERARFDREAEREAEKQRREAEEAARRARTPPPPPLTPPPQIPGLPGAPPLLAEAVDESAGVRSTVNAIAHFAHMGGPLGSAVAGTATSVANLPGVAQGLATAMPGLSAAAPYIGVAAAALAVPAAGIALVNNEIERARAIVTGTGFSPEASMAESQASVRQLLADIKTAQRLGDEVAEGITLRSRRGAALQGARDVLAEPILEAANNLSALATKISEGVGGFIERNDKLIQSLEKFTLKMILPQSLQTLIEVGGIFKDKSPEDFAGGLLGIVPERPDLPPPFGPATSLDKASGTSRRNLGIPGLTL